MSNYDEYITGTDKPFAENINDALLLSNVFDLTVPIQAPTMFKDSSWIDTTSRRKCGVAILTLEEALPSGVSISTVDGQSVLTGTGTVKLGFYPNFNSFGRFKSISWEDIGTVQVNLKTVNNTTILSNIPKGIIENPSGELRKLQEIVIEIILNNSTLKTIDIVMENKQQTRYGAEVGISDVTGLDDTITAIQGKDTEQDGRLSLLEGTVNDLFDLIYPVGSIYMSVNSTNPSVFFGGTWEQIKDTFLLATGDTYANGSTGGEATHTLTENEMPSHTHIQNSHNHTQNSHNHTQNSHNHTQNAHHHALTGSKSVGIQEGDRLRVGYGSASGSKNTNNATATNKATTATNNSATATNNPQTATNKYAGGGQAHNNMPPYLVVNVWKRTA